MKYAFAGLISRLNIAKGRISEFEDLSIETSQTEIQREKIMKKKGQNIQVLQDKTISKGVKHT